MLEWSRRSGCPYEIKCIVPINPLVPRDPNQTHSLPFRFPFPSPTKTYHSPPYFPFFQSQSLDLARKSSFLLSRPPTTPLHPSTKALNASSTSACFEMAQESVSEARTIKIQPMPLTPNSQPVFHLECQPSAQLFSPADAINQSINQPLAKTPSINSPCEPMSPHTHHPYTASTSTSAHVQKAPSALARG